VKKKLLAIAVVVIILAAVSVGVALHYMKSEPTEAQPSGGAGETTAMTGASTSNLQADKWGAILQIKTAEELMPYMVMADEGETQAVGGFIMKNAGKLRLPEGVLFCECAWTNREIGSPYAEAWVRCYETNAGYYPRGIDLAAEMVEAPNNREFWLCSQEKLFEVAEAAGLLVSDYRGIEGDGFSWEIFKEIKQQGDPTPYLPDIFPFLGAA